MNERILSTYSFIQNSFIHSFFAKKTQKLRTTDTNLIKLLKTDKSYHTMYKSLIILSTTIVLLACTMSTKAQDIELINPSFEGVPEASIPPDGWRDCGQPGETPVDTQPNGTFRVYTPAKDGETYLGMVTRDTDTWESVGQMLETPLEGGVCYDFSLSLTRSESYLSRRKNEIGETGNNLVQFTQPIRLRIWGGNNYCDKKELLEETKTIDHTRWKEYKFKLKPVREYHFIMLEAFYMTPTLVAYNGNILVDDCSTITVTSCDDDPLIAQNTRMVNKSPRKKNKKKNKSKTSPKPEKKDEIVDTKKKEKEVEETKKPVLTPPKEENPIVEEVPEKKPEIKKEPNSIAQNQPEEKKEEPVVEKTPPKPEKKPEPQSPITMSELDEVDLAEGQIIRVDRLSFPANSSQLVTSSYEIIDAVYDFLKRNQYIVIEIGGHTNGIPSHDYCNKLSKERAESVAQYLIEKGIESERITAEGYGKTQPIADNDTASGRKRNQRVEIKIISIGG